MFQWKENGGRKGRASALGSQRVEVDMLYALARVTRDIRHNLSSDKHGLSGRLYGGIFRDEQASYEERRSWYGVIRRSCYILVVSLYRDMRDVGISGGERFAEMKAKRIV